MSLQRPQWVCVVCGMAFAALSLIGGLLAHGLAHNAPWLAWLFVVFSSPSFLVNRILEDGIGVDISRSGEYLLILIVQFLVGVFLCRGTLLLWGKIRRQKGKEPE